MIRFRKVSGKHVNPISHTAEMLKKKKFLHYTLVLIHKDIKKV